MNKKKTKIKKRTTNKKNSSGRREGPKKSLPVTVSVYKTGSSGCEEILCAGFGGQGIMFMGKLLAQSGLIDSMSVTWMPSYGAEVRGGTAHSMVKIGESPIPSPTIAQPTICVVMNKPSLQKFFERVRPGGFLLVNTTLIDGSPKRGDITVLNVPVTGIASKLGTVKVANMVAIGALIRKTRLFSIKTIMAALQALLEDKGEDIFLLNKKAFEAGYRSVRG
ncbi:MAG: 2-oxoacid:acceptor oxidoreductase family protein [Candidatus Omnitrophota bacterium]